jgi:protein-disulfide isomerase
MRSPKFLLTIVAAVGFAFSQAPASAEVTPDSGPLGGPTIAAAFDVSKPYATDLVIGYADAPITIIEYASLTCPHCAHFHNDVYPTMKKDWIDTGKVKFVYRDFPLDQSAFFASIAVSCLPVEQRPKAIASFFENQSAWPSASFETGVGALLKKDVDPNVDLVKVKACVANEDQQKKVAVPALDIRQAKQIEGTPAIFINGKPFTGTRSVESIGEAIQDLLATKK